MYIRSNYAEISRPGADGLIVFSHLYQAPFMLGTITSKGLHIIIAYHIPLQTRYAPRKTSTDSFVTSLLASTHVETVPSLLRSQYEATTPLTIGSYFKPKSLGERNVEIALEACGTCGSDIRTLTGSWGKAKLLVCVGHEVVGKVVRIGPQTTSH
ncbi:NADPH-dependent medium chain alcohol dehydrogenase [Penicillium solitum]|uniref:NADPH-dependent medium chain alcohol dehydrogenase n=1 Tax=Penicillium solitum TaxID=60172 RepID=UPI0017E3AE84|nr:hypothetical protein HAV15_012426 [Penicillium sp. str. \